MSDLCIVIEDAHGDYQFTIKLNDKGELHFDVSPSDRNGQWGTDFTADPKKFLGQLKAVLELYE